MYNIIYNIFSYISNNPIFLALTLICTVLGTVWAKNGIAKKRLSLSTNSFPIIRDSVSNIPNVNILYKEQPISNLTISNFTIWNSRTKSILKSDIVPKAPLCFRSINPNATILDISVIQSNKLSNNAEIILKENTFNFSFDYLDKKNGVVIQVIHTGQGSDIVFDGEIIGGYIKCENISSNPILKHLTKPLSSRVNQIMDAVSLFCISITLLFFAIFVGIAIMLTAFSWITLFLLIIMLLIFSFYFILYKLYFTVPRSLHSNLNLDK